MSHTNKLIGLRQELEHVEAYIKVVNFKENLTVHLTTVIEDDSLHSIQIPQLTLQPLVENAVKHGVNQTDANIHVAITAQKTESAVMITVWDNGCGIPPTKVEDLNGKLRDGTLANDRIGLRNVNERLKLSFGDPYGLRLRSEAGRYTESIVCLPIIGEEDAVPDDA